MGYKAPQPDVGAFSDQAQQNVVRRIYQRVSALENVTQSHSSSNGVRQSAPPAQAALNVNVSSSVKGHAFVRITNPEYLASNGNPAGSPITHWLRASPVADMSSTVTDFGVNPSTYYDISELGSGSFYFQLRSTTDGHTFNQPVNSGQVTIP